jgi:heterogeneous nuclear ribonucleoprotein F/H
MYEHSDCMLCSIGGVGGVNVEGGGAADCSTPGDGDMTVMGTADGGLGLPKTPGVKAGGGGVNVEGGWVNVEGGGVNVEGGGVNVEGGGVNVEGGGANVGGAAGVLGKPRKPGGD